MTSSDATDHKVEAKQDESDNAWVEEVSRRADEIRNGDVELVDGKESQRLIRQRLAARRRA